MTYFFKFQFLIFCKKSNICFRISQKSKYAENQHVYLQTITLTGSSSAISTSSSSASSFGSSLISSPCSSLFSSTRFPIAPPEKYYSKHIFIHNFIKLELNLRFIKYQLHQKYNFDQLDMKVFCSLHVVSLLGVNVRNMKMDLNIYGTWRRVGQ